MRRPQYRVQISLHLGIVQRGFGYGKTVSWSPWRTLKGFDTLEAALEAAQAATARVGLARCRVTYGGKAVA
jgi:hypothetical protein